MKFSPAAFIAFKIIALRQEGRCYNDVEARNLTLDITYLKGHEELTSKNFMITCFTYTVQCIALHYNAFKINKFTLLYNTRYLCPMRAYFFISVMLHATQRKSVSTENRLINCTAFTAALLCETSYRLMLFQNKNVAKSEKLDHEMLYFLDRLNGAS